MSAGRFLQQAAAGNAGEAVYVDDLFSTYLYEGNNTGGSSTPTNTITNGIDLDGEGGLVWLKARSNAASHNLIDTERGVGKYLSCDGTSGDGTPNSGFGLTAFNSDGFTLGGSWNTENFNGYDYVSWTFRKQPGFFDVVTYTGTGSTRTIEHNIGSTPGFIIVKRTDTTEDWTCWHNGIGGLSSYIELNKTGGYGSNSGVWSNTAPTDSVFTVGSHSRTNASGGTYVAYLFAHDAQDFGTGSDESIIKCGSYTGNNSATGPAIDLGFEPQWVIIKNINTTGNWNIYDSMRGIVTGGNEPFLHANNANADNYTTDRIQLTSTGFQVLTNSPNVNSAHDFIYMAIARPHKPAKEFAATDLFAIDTSGGTSPTPPRYTSGFPVDLVYQRTNVSATNAGAWWTRLTASLLYPSLTDAESTSSSYSEYFAENEGFQDLTSVSSTNYAWMFRRAPGFFDVVAYAGTSSSTTPINHNLGVKPELIISKARNSTGSWEIYCSYLNGGVESYKYRLFLEGTNAIMGPSNNYWYQEPTDSAFYASQNGNMNNAGSNYVAYLFASVPGISKVGTVSHTTGSTTDVDCGFSSGARFVLVKRIDNGGGHWVVVDSLRGINAGNDPYLLLSSTAAQVTNQDVIDPLSSGFQMQGFFATGTWLFLAIA